MQGLPESLSILLPKQHIFLLSHMRAYTSLFGHIMGSHPAICGYYEMHIGYHSWRSLVRQKLLYLRSENVKPGSSHMFDKVLHDDHEVAVRVLNREDVRAIFSLRHPRHTIPSILELYRDVEPGHEFTSESFAVEYYIKRLQTLTGLTASLGRPYFYMDAEALVKQPEESLDSLGNWLRLARPLSPHYEVQRKTSEQRYGDTSEKIESGHIVRDAPDRERAKISPENLARAADAYATAREALAAGSARRCLLD